MDSQFKERQFKLGDHRVTAGILDISYMVQYYLSDQTLWFRGGGDHQFSKVPEEDIRNFMRSFPNFTLEEPRDGVPHMILVWTTPFPGPKNR